MDDPEKAPRAHGQCQKHGSAEAAETPQAETSKPGRVSRELATIVIVAVLLVGIGAITLPLNMQAYLDAGTAFISLCSALIS